MKLSLLPLESHQEGDPRGGRVTKYDSKVGKEFWHKFQLLN